MSNTQGSSEPMKQEDYIKSPGQCPVCRSHNIEGGSVTINNTVATQDVGCNDCFAEWSDVYHLTGYQLNE